MLEALDLSRKLSKPEYRERLPSAQRRLHQLQRACREAGVATIVVFEGWDAAGKGTAISKLTQRLEPRAFKLHAIREPRTAELHLPWMWRHWVKVPNWGELAIFDRSWYGRVLVQRVEGRVGKRECRQAYRDIVSFERALGMDRYVIVKFFLHISKKVQKARFEALESDPVTSWHVDPEDWEHHRKYDDYALAVEEVLARTETEWAPWTLVEATDRRWTRVKIFDTLIDRMEQGLLSHGCPIPGSASEDKDDPTAYDYVEAADEDD